MYVVQQKSNKLAYLLEIVAKIATISTLSSPFEQKSSKLLYELQQFLLREKKLRKLLYVVQLLM
ncbi:hypothetical protein ASD40_14550 [Paenibacillus sp. Root444D2]|nr:hypothetical protein ASD40_14550 [Paenibacillus sp. Root444D2]